MEQMPVKRFEPNVVRRHHPTSFSADCLEILAEFREESPLVLETFRNGKGLCIVDSPVVGQLVVATVAGFGIFQIQFVWTFRNRLNQNSFRLFDEIGSGFQFRQLLPGLAVGDSGAWRRRFSRKVRRNFGNASF